MALMQKEPELKDISRRRIPRLRLCCWWRFYFWNGRISNFWAVFPKTTIWLHKQDRLFIVLLSILKTFSEKVAITGDFKSWTKFNCDTFLETSKSSFLVLFTSKNIRLIISSPTGSRERFMSIPFHDAQVQNYALWVDDCCQSRQPL